MKKFILLVLLLALSAAPGLSENTISDLYDYDGETYDMDAAYDVEFANSFVLTLPAGWLNYEVTEEQSGNGIFACFGDGTHFMFVKGEEDIGAYEDMTEYALTLSMNADYASIFTTDFAGQEFVCYNDYQFASSNCATLLKGVGLYTFYFYPADGNAEFAQTVIELMDSFKLTGGD